MNTSITPMQKKQCFRFVEDGLNKSCLSREEFQRVLAQGGEMQKRFESLLTELGKGKYVDEEVKSNYDYPIGYHPLSVPQQVAMWNKYFPGIGDADQRAAKKRLPKYAEGYAVFPRWQYVAGVYHEALEKIFALLYSQRDFYNFRKGELGPDRLRQHTRTIRMLAILGHQQEQLLLETAEPQP